MEKVLFHEGFESAARNPGSIHVELQRDQVVCIVEALDRLIHSGDLTKSEKNSSRMALVVVAFPALLDGLAEQAREQRSN